MRIGIYGGTFNPPHIGHLQSARAAAKQLGLELLLIVPAGIPPHKELAEGTPPAWMRLEMAQAAFLSEPHTIVTDIEIRNSGPGYTIDTVNAIKTEYPGSQLFLLVGTDMYLTLDTWKDSVTLLKTITPAVFSRSFEDTERISLYSEDLQKRFGVQTEIVTNCVVEISSSSLRELLPKREGAGYITDTTYSYIIKYRLYGAKPAWDWLRARARSMLDPIRIPHVDGCEAEAVRLAERWNVDIDDAREAAILHDITKRLNLAENTIILEEHGIPVGKIERAEEKLLHSKSGAALAKTLFGVSEEVAGAIRWHTTGRAGMSVLEKVIYLADYIEPTRDFQEVGHLRKAAYNDIDEALKMGLELSIQDMIARGIKPNSITFEALDDLKG